MYEKFVANIYNKAVRFKSNVSKIYNFDRKFTINRNFETEIFVQVRLKSQWYDFGRK